VKEEMDLEMDTGVEKGRNYTYIIKHFLQIFRSFSTSVLSI
jgi:hypothetical protein